MEIKYQITWQFAAPERPPEVVAYVLTYEDGFRIRALLTDEQYHGDDREPGVIGYNLQPVEPDEDTP